MRRNYIMKKRIFLILTAVLLLVGAFAMSVAAADSKDIYVASSGDDTNAGTEAAPVAGLNKALELVENGGTVHIVGELTLPEGFVWENHGKDVTITGGTLNFSQACEAIPLSGETANCVIQADAVTYDAISLVFADNTLYVAGGFRLCVNEDVTTTGDKLRVCGGGIVGSSGTKISSVSSTDVTLLGGDFFRVYGGGYNSMVTGDTNLYIGGNFNSEYETDHYGSRQIHGGCYYDTVGGNVNLTVAGGNTDHILGVGDTENAVKGSANILISGGNSYSLYGGGHNCQVDGGINLTVTGGQIAQLFGANRVTSYTGDVNVHLMGGTITRRFFGGCYNDDDNGSDNFHVTGNVNVCLYEGMDFAWDSSELDRGFYAHSRYDTLFEDEKTTLWYMGAAAQEKHSGNVGSQSTGMSSVMGSASVADTVCVVKVQEWNVVLGDDIGANFYVNVPESVAKTSVVKATVNGLTKTYNLSKQTNGLYLVSVNVAAAQMTEAIDLKLVTGSTEVAIGSYTVREYADVILTGDYADEIKALVKHMLNYGAVAQQYFGVNTENLTNDGYVLDYTAQFPTEYPAFSVSGQISGVKVYGASLVMDSQVAVRLYFAADSVDDVTFSAGGKEYTAVQKHGMYYVEVAGINPHEYADVITLSAMKDGEVLNVSYSPLTYFVRMSQKGSDTLKALVNAMYGYHEAAVNYVATYGAVVKLPDVTGGTVTSNQNVYEQGQTVILNAEPDSGYNLKSLTVKKDGVIVDIGAITLAGGSYSFTAENGIYTVEAEFVEKIFLETDNYDVTGQYDGSIIFLNAADASNRTVKTYASTYRDVAVTIKDHTPSERFSAELYFTFDSGTYAVRVETKDAGYRVQNIKSSLVANWGELYPAFDDAQIEKLRNEGMTFRVVIAGRNANIYLDGVCVATQELPEAVANEAAQVALIMYGNTGVENIEIPISVRDGASEDVTFTVQKKNADSVMSFAGVEFTLTLKDDATVKYTGTVDADGKLVLQDMPVGTYQVSAVNFIGRELRFSDVQIQLGDTEKVLNYTQGINDNVNNASVTVDVKNSSFHISDLTGSGYFFLQGQNLTGNVWFGMKVQLSTEDLNAADYRNIGLNIYKNGSNRIQVVSLGSGRAAVKYDDAHVKELSADLVKVLEAGNLLLAANRTAEGKLEVYAGIHSGEMEKLFTVDSPNMGTDTLDQFGLDVQGPLEEAALENLVSGDSMASVLTDAQAQTVTVQLKSKSEHMSFAGVELTFTLKRDTGVKFTATADQDGKLVLTDVPVGAYAISNLDFFGGKLTFDDIILWEGRTAVELTHKEGINDVVGSAGAQIDAATSCVVFKDSVASTNRSDGYFFLQGQKLSGEQWFAAKVKMSETSLADNSGAFVSLCIYENGWNLIQVMSGGDGTASVKYNYNYPAELPDALQSALTGDGMYLVANRAADGTLCIYGGANAGQMLKLITVTDTSDPKSNMGAADLDQFGFMTQGNIPDASIENLTSGTTADAALSGFAVAQEDVTFTVQDKSNNSAMSFEGVSFTLTLKTDASVTHTGTADANGKLVIEDMVPGTYAVSSVQFFGTQLTFSDVTLGIGETEKELTYTQGINDNVNNAAVTVDVKDSTVSISDLTSGKGYFFLQSQNLTGDAWFGMKVQISAEDLAAADYRNIGLQTYGTGGADYVQILNNNGNGVLIKYDNSNYCKLSDEMVTALNSGELHLVICRTSAGKLEVYAGTAANKMVKLFAVASPKITTNAIEQFGVNLNGSISDAAVKNLTYGATAEAAMPGFVLAKEDVTVSIQAKSSRMTFEGVQLTFTLKQDTSVSYTATADANDRMAVGGMLHGTYSVSSIDFLGGKLTFPDITVTEGTTAVQITHNEGIQDDITSDASKVSVSVATSSVYFSDYTASGRNNGAFYLKDQTLTGDVWFAMRMKVSAADWKEKDGYPYIAWNSYVGNNWNFVQMMNNNGNGVGVIKYNNNYATGLNADLAANLTGDGLLMLLNRTSSGTMDVYLGTCADDMKLMFTINATASTGKPALNMGTNTLDNFGFLVEGKIGSASIENMVSGTSMDDVLEEFQ